MEILKMTNDYMMLKNTDPKKKHSLDSFVTVTVHIPDGFTWGHVGNYWSQKTLKVMGKVIDVIEQVNKDKAQYITLSELSFDCNKAQDIIPWTLLYEDLVMYDGNLRLKKIKDDLNALCQLHNTENIDFVKTKEELFKMVSVLRRKITELYQEVQKLIY